MKITTQPLPNSMSRPSLRRGVFLIPLALACFALSPLAQAQLNPAPDGGYDNFNTAEGTSALSHLDTGLFGGSENTAIGYRALYMNHTSSYNTATGAYVLYNNVGENNTANGYFALNGNTDGDNNTATGAYALFKNTNGPSVSGHDNTATGFDALSGNTIGIQNTANGSNALVHNTTGNFNTADGFSALQFNTTGSSNVAIGVSAGRSLTTGSGNVCIGVNVFGVSGESNTTRIRNVYSSIASGRAVYVNSDNKIGTLSSSRRYKKEIKPMDKASEAILALNPVSFRYKKEIDAHGTKQFGLIAEEVEKVDPDLVTRDEEGKPETVRYEAVNAMLLNEFLKEHRKVEEQSAMIAKQQKQIEALTSALQKVSAQLELNKSAPRTVANNQ